jgi:hypothetical protein
VAPTITVEDIAGATAFAEGHPTVVDSSHLVKNLPSFNSASDALPSTPAATGEFMV